MPSADERAGSLSGIILDRTTTCKKTLALDQRKLRLYITDCEWADSVKVTLCGFMILAKRFSFCIGYTIRLQYAVNSS